MLRSSVPAADAVYMGDVYRKNFEHVARIGGAASQHGVVFRARSRIDGVDYAIKVKQRPTGQLNEASPAAKEMLALAALPQHPNIVRYHTAWVDKGNIYVQLELCWGGSLSTQLYTTGVSFTERQVRECGRQIASGLAHLHALNLAHLDVKPDNIFVAFSQVAAADPIRAAGIVQDSAASSEAVFRRMSPRLNAMPALGSARVEHTVAVDEHCSYRIGDFGLVTALHDSARAEDGDARYLPREMLEREGPIDLTKVDIFSLGCTLLELSRGTNLPGRGADWEAIRQGCPPSLPTSFSHSFTVLLHSMLAPAPERRPSAADLLNHPLFLPWPLDALHSTVKGQYSIDPAVGRLDEAFSTLSPR
jgi:serine/threonine protein kinase